MATIVQPYNPWREQLALTALGNVAGSIIGDIWKTHQQNEQNRKINAFRGQLNQDLNNNVAQGQGVSLVPQNLPEGYNSNPWANAFHKTDNPITQFDLGTAGAAQNTQRTPSIRDIMQGVARLAATPRFSMLGADTVNNIRDDLLQGAYADMFANAGNIGDQMTALAMGAAHGKVPYQVLNAYAPWGIHSTPNHESKIVDAGNNQVVMDYNPKDGSTSVVSVIPKGVNPTQKYLADSGAIVNSERNAIMNRELDIRENQNLREWENPTLITFTDANGNVYMIHPRTGQATTVTDEAGNQVVGASGHYQIDVQRLKSLDNEFKELSEQRTAYAKALSRPDRYEADELEQARIEIERLDKLIAQNRKQYNDMYNSLRPQRRQTTPTTTQPTQPTTTQPTSVSRVMALGESSPDVIPQTPPTTTPPQNTGTQNSSTWGGFIPHLVRVIGDDVTPIVMALGNESPDVRPQTQPITTPPANTQRQPRPTERNMREFTVSDDFAYDPVRDKDIIPTRIYTEEHFRKFIKRLQEDPRFSRYSTEQLLEYAYRLGYRIRQ